MGPHFTKHEQGVENVYAQHVPLMMTTVEAALRSKLKDNAFPAVGAIGGKPQEVGYAAVFCHVCKL